MFVVVVDVVDGADVWALAASGQESQGGGSENGDGTHEKSPLFGAPLGRVGGALTTCCLQGCLHP